MIGTATDWNVTRNKARAYRIAMNCNKHWLCTYTRVTWHAEAHMGIENSMAAIQHRLHLRGVVVLVILRRPRVLRHAQGGKDVGPLRSCELKDLSVLLLSLGLLFPQRRVWAPRRSAAACVAHAAAHNSCVWTAEWSWHVPGPSLLQCD